VFRADCKANREIWENNNSFRRRPHVLAIRRILPTLSRIRAELAGEFSLAIREVYFMDQSKSVPANDIARNKHTAPAKNIVDTLIAAGNFTTFAAGIKAAGLTEELAAQGPFTVFAPTDEAFKRLPSGSYDLLRKDPARFKAVLNYHVVRGTFMAKDMKSGEVMTMQGSTLTAAVSSSDVRVNEARITQADLVAANGTVHAIDTVILPKNWQLLAAAA
jgi:uncharacterized surface protein with fasciclin (FAS1) repeats